MFFLFNSWPYCTTTSLHYNFTALQPHCNYNRCRSRQLRLPDQLAVAVKFKTFEMLVPDDVANGMVNDSVYGTFVA